LPEEQQLSGAGARSALTGGTIVVNVVLTIVGLVSAGLVPFGANFLVGHELGPAVLGSVSVVLGLGLFLGQIPGTLSSSATKFIAESLGRDNSSEAKQSFQFLLAICLWVSLALAAGLVLCSRPLAGTFHVSVTSIVLAGFLVPAYSLYLYFKSVYYGVQAVPSYLGNEIVSDVLFFAALAPLLLGRMDAWLLAAFVINNVIFSVIAAWQLRDLFQGFSLNSLLLRSSRIAHRRRMLTYSGANGLGTAASLGRWSLATAVAGLFLSHSSVGLLAAAMALTGPLALLPRAISLVTFSMMARLHGAGDSRSVRAVMETATQWLALLLVIPSGLAILNARSIVAALFGQSFAAAGAAMALVIAGAYVTDISRPSIDALSSTTHVRVPMFASVAGLLVSLATWLGLVPLGGITMAGFGFAAGAVVTAALPAAFACRVWKTPASIFARPAIELGALAILSAVPDHPVLVSVAFTAGSLALYGDLVISLCRGLRTYSFSYVRRQGSGAI
jgi:O-antigen/teichoic acid export membrane protein